MNKLLTAPNFSLVDQEGKLHDLKDYAGKWLVLYFYPKDSTPGCTVEACNFRDSRDTIADLGGATVIGISKDLPKSHKKFVDKNKLNFTLLSDPQHTTIEAYGAWKLRKFMGREYMGIVRSTVIINPAGMVVKTYPEVDPKLHAQEIIADLRSLQSLV